MANRYCTKCGREVVAGKRFCGGCGQGMPVAAAPPDEAEAVAEPAAPVCGQCAAALTPGKRFCKQCGHAVNAPTVSTDFDLPHSVPVPVELPETAAGDPAPMVASLAPAAETEIAPQVEFTSETVPASKWEPVEETVPLPAASSAAIPAPAPVSGDRSKAKIGLAIGLGAAVLVVAGGAWAWYAHAHRSVSSGAGQAAQTQQSTVQSPVHGQAFAVPDTTVQPTKPSAGAPATAVSEALRTPPQPAPNHAPSVAIQPQSSSQSWHGNPAAPTPAFRVAPAPSSTPLPTQPAQARSGIRHYEGPPVPHGGTVVFDNLPKARLKFKFDHAAWQLLIKPNPDGTKKVILSSLVQGHQSSCDLGWEIVE